MKRIFALAAAVAALLTLCLSASAFDRRDDRARAVARKSEKRETAIKEVVNRMYQSWSEGDGKAFAALFHPLADFVSINGWLYTGRDSIEKGCEQIFKTIYKESRYPPTIRSMVIMRSDLAIVHLQWLLNAQESGKDRPTLAYSMLVMSEVDGKWGIDAFQSTAVQLAR
jgi:uncharacterized protein (TIGR02246 family)